MTGTTEPSHGSPVDPSFIRPLVHDLRGALMVAGQLLEELGTGHMTPAEHDAVVARIARSIRAVDEIASRALALDDAERQLTTEPVVPVDIAAAVASAVADVDPVDPPVIDVGEGDRVIRGRRESIVAAIAELVRNAEDHTPLGTAVAIRIRSDVDAVTVVVDDDGPGVPDAVRGDIFEPFERAGARTHRGGLGLGLAIVRRVAEVHAGRVTVGDAPGGGGRFALRLPRGGVT